MPYRWPADTVLPHIALHVEDRWCQTCGCRLTVYAHRHRRLCTLNGPLHVVCKLPHCPAHVCPAHTRTISPEAETALAMPWGVRGWDVVRWLGQRRFARHWSVGQRRAEVADTDPMRVSDDAMERSIRRDQQRLAARPPAPALWAAAYADVDAVSLAIAGLQPEQGHATLDVVRDLEQKRVGGAEALLSSATAEVQPLLVQARVGAERLGKPVRLWMSEQPDAGGRGSAAACPGVPPRYGAPHCLRDVAQPVGEAASQAQVKRRRTIRGVRAIARAVLAARQPPEPTQRPADPPEATPSAAVQAAEAAEEVGRDDGAAVRGILHDDPSGPLHPPGRRLAEA